MMKRTRRAVGESTRNVGGAHTTCHSFTYYRDTSQDRLSVSICAYPTKEELFRSHNKQALMVSHGFVNQQQLLNTQRPPNLYLIYATIYYQGESNTDTSSLSFK